MLIFKEFQSCFDLKNDQYLSNKYLKIVLFSSTALVFSYSVYCLHGYLAKKSQLEETDDYYSNFVELKSQINEIAFECQTEQTLSYKTKTSALNYNKSVILKKEKRFVNKPVMLKHERQQKINEFYEFLKEKLDPYPDIIYRNFIINNDIFTKTPVDINRQFRIMQWNGLAKKLSSELKKPKSNPESIDWANFRQWRLLEEIVRYNSDIICLQEADFYDDIKSYLHYLGYTSIFCPKYSPTRVYNNDDPDGCAIFYHTSMFQITQLRCQNINIKGVNNSQVFIIMQLKHKLTKKRVNIVCAHLKAYGEYSEKRVEQTEFILNTLKESLDDPTCSEGLDELSCVLCGDFNGNRNEKFYKLITSDQREIHLTDAYLKHSGNFKFNKNVDYIFYTKSNLKLVNYLDLSSNLTSRSLPSLTYPSDHLSLVCDFQFC